MRIEISVKRKKKIINNNTLKKIIRIKKYGNFKKISRKFQKLLDHKKTRKVNNRKQFIIIIIIFIQKRKKQFYFSCLKFEIKFAKKSSVDT